MSTAPSRTPAAVRATDWLSSLDDVLGPDDGKVALAPDLWDGHDRFRWHPPRTRAAEPWPPGLEAMARELADAEGLDGWAARELVARRLRETVARVARVIAAKLTLVFQATLAGARRFNAALAGFVARIRIRLTEASRLERSRQQRIATQLGRRDRRAARNRKRLR